MRKSAGYEKKGAFTPPKRKEYRKKNVLYAHGRNRGPIRGQVLIEKKRKLGIGRKGK